MSDVPEALIEKAVTAIPTLYSCSYDRHVARAVLEAVADDIRAQALREAADAWQQGGWGDAIPGPKINGRVPLILSMAQRAAEWLRSRADRLAGPVGADGKHGNLHTDHCGCADKLGPNLGDDVAPDYIPAEKETQR